MPLEALKQRENIRCKPCDAEHDERVLSIGKPFVPVCVLRYSSDKLNDSSEAGKKPKWCASSQV